jgi:hypothetical protein
MSELQTALAEYFATHAEAVERFGTYQPELLDSVPAELRDRMQRQRQKVSASIQANDVKAHLRHVEACTKGLRLVMRRLSGC